MIVIADGGSTKCDWLIAGRNGELVAKVRTEGMNPALLKEEEILEVLRRDETLTTYAAEATHVYFYGAGCGLAANQQHMQIAFLRYFQKAETVDIREDILAAVYACTSTSGVVSILGTGSNACYFDGEQVHIAIPSLGYSLMDQGSGNHMGKLLLQAYYFKKMPPELAEKFSSEYPTDPTFVKNSLYKKPYPNAFLASYTKFALENLDNPFVESIVRQAIREFADTHLVHYEEQLQKVPVHFVGSVAWYARDVIKKEMAERGWETGAFVQRPIDRLFEFHTRDLGA